MQRYPVFVVGSPRSGTSILVDALLSVGYNGFREGSFLSVISPLRNAIDRHYSIFHGNSAILISHIEKEIVKDQLWRILKGFVDRANPVEPWFDKTGNPEMIEIIPEIRKLWPESVFIFCKRRAIENVVSRLKKFPAHTFEYHCADWSKNMSSWRKVRQDLPQDMYIEVDQQDIIQGPNEIASKLRTFLVGTDESVTTMAKVFLLNRPQQSYDGSAAVVTSLEGIDWTETWKDVFRTRCGEELEAFGYSLDDNYWKRPEHGLIG